MSCKCSYYTNVDGKKYYAVEYINATNLDDIKVQHEEGKSNNDVKVVQFSDSTLSQVPQGLTKVFPNMSILHIWNSKLKVLSKMDLAEYKNLRGFNCIGNELEFLPGDLFEGFKDLEWISFWKNNLRVIEPNILDGLDKLKHVSFRRNINYDNFFMVSIYSMHSIVTLKQLKSKLFEKFKQINYLKSKMNEEVTEGSLLSDLKDYIQDENSKDFRIEIGGREFSVHKFLLKIRSPTFAEMLRNNPEAESLKLVDIPVEVFEAILKFLYTDELPQDDGTNFFHLFAAASRLKIKKLTGHAAMKILDQMNSENALAVLDLGNKHEHVELRQKAFEEIKKKYPAIKFKDDWAMDTEKVKKMIEFFKKMEQEFTSLMD